MRKIAFLAFWGQKSSARAKNLTPGPFRWGLSPPPLPSWTGGGVRPPHLLLHRSIISVRFMCIYSFNSCATTWVGYQLGRWTPPPLGGGGEFGLTKGWAGKNVRVFDWVGWGHGKSAQGPLPKNHLQCLKVLLSGFVGCCRALLGYVGICQKLSDFHNIICLEVLAHIFASA